MNSAEVALLPAGPVLKPPKPGFVNLLQGLNVSVVGGPRSAQVLVLLSGIHPDMRYGRTLSKIIPTF